MNSLEIAAKAGIDLSLIEAYLRLTPEQRLQQHQFALNALEQLQSAYKSAVTNSQNDRTQQPPAETV